MSHACGMCGEFMRPVENTSAALYCPNAANHPIEPTPALSIESRNTEPVCSTPDKWHPWFEAHLEGVTTPYVGLMDRPDGTPGNPPGQDPTPNSNTQ